MEAYITDSLATGLIRPSSSPISAGFFFFYLTLHPWIDYRGLNDIMVKNKYPLRNAYHLVKIRDMDEWKTAQGCQFCLRKYSEFLSITYWEM